MSEVGALIVSLRAETAQFREDMGKVKSDLDCIKGSSEGAGAGIESSMSKARGGLMLVEDAVGVRLPRHLNSLLAEMPLVASVFSVMLPIAGVAVAIKIIGELIEKHQAAAEAARQHAFAEAESGIKGQQALNGLDDKLLEVGKRTDELTGNHLGALKNELELIDHQSMNELISSFEKFGGTAEKIVDDIQKSVGKMDIWESGVKGVKSAYQAFTLQYEGYLTTATKANGNEEKAEVLRKNTLASAITVLNAQKEINKAVADGTIFNQHNNQLLADQAILQAVNLGNTEKDVAAQQAWVNVLELTGQAKEKIAAIAKGESNNASISTANTLYGEQAALQKMIAAGVEQHSQALIKLARTQSEATMAASKGGEDDNIDGKLAKQKAAIEAEKNDSIAASQVELTAKLAVYQADLAAAGTNVAKKKELTAQWANEVHAYSDSVAQFNADADKKIIAADRDAANERLAISKSFHAAIDSAAAQDAILGAEIKRKADEQAAKNELALHHGTAAQVLAVEQASSKAQTQAEVSALNERLKNLDTFDKNYLKNFVELKHAITEAEAKGDAEVKALAVTAAQQQAMEIQAAENKMKEAIASDIANSIVMNKSLAASFRQTGEQMAEQMIKNLIMMELTGDKEQLLDAKKAYHKAFAANADIPPAPMWGYAAGALAFAAVMSMETGGKIPGDGAVPIVGHGGETVVTKALTDRVEAGERGGNNGASGQHNWNFSPVIHAMDAEGVDRVLQKHSSIFQRHVGATLRRMNQ